MERGDGKDDDRFPDISQVSPDCEDSAERNFFLAVLHGNNAHNHSYCGTSVVSGEGSPKIMYLSKSNSKLGLR